MNESARLALSRARLEQAKERMEEALECGPKGVRFGVVCELRQFFRRFGLRLEYASEGMAELARDEREEQHARVYAGGWAEPSDAEHDASTPNDTRKP